jgi:hypothetical protein
MDTTTITTTIMTTRDIMTLGTTITTPTPIITPTTSKGRGVQQPRLELQHREVASGHLDRLLQQYKALGVHGWGEQEEGQRQHTPTQQVA